MLALDDMVIAASPLLITDELAAPADFLLHQLLSGYMKGQSTPKAVIASVSGDLAWWNAVSSRTGLNFVQKLEEKSITFLDMSADIASSQSQVESAALSSLLKQIDDAVNNARPAEHVLVIFDDITTLEWIGYSSLDVVRFSRALVSSCAKLNVSLIIRHHIVVPDEPDVIFRMLLQLCPYHIEVRPLATGKSGAVSGEVSVHLGASLRTSPLREIPRSQAVQYRLNDYNAVFFERGTGQAVL